MTVPFQFKPQGRDQVLVEAKSMASGKLNRMVFNCSEEIFLQGLSDFQTGAKIQVAFPFLTSDEREFLLSGMTSEEWDDMFGGSLLHEF